jgi:hypothetical protein
VISMPRILLSLFLINLFIQPVGQVKALQQGPVTDVLLKIETNFYQFEPFPPNPDHHGAAQYPSNAHPHAGEIGGGTGTGLQQPAGACVVPDLPDSRDITRTFKRFLELHNPCRTIWIPNDVTVNLTHLIDETDDDLSYLLFIEKDVEILSGRDSDSEGGMIRLDEVINKSAIIVRNANVRISGLRIQGPADPRRFNTGDFTTGIRSECFGPACSHSNFVLVVDNSHFSLWGIAAISITNNTSGIIHHNTFVDNKANSGYGVVVSRGGQALIEANLFRNNRHAIAGSGNEGDGYSAGWNIIERPSGITTDELPQFPSHDFDMHGGLRDMTGIAGDFIDIYNNTFEYGPGQTGIRYRGNIVIRGMPSRYTRIAYNTFTVIEPERAIRQIYSFGNMRPNYRHNTFGAASMRKGWYVSWGGKSDWYRITTDDSNIKNYYHGFIRKGTSDTPDTTHILKTGRGNWYVAKFSRRAGALYPIWRNETEWSVINDATLNIHDVRFGDFNGNGNTDVFASWEGYWRVSHNGAQPWQPLRWATETVSQLAFGDFNGSGITDVFSVEADNNAGRVYWKVSYGGTEEDTTINTFPLAMYENIKLDRLRFGDFNGDGITDVFASWDGNWRIWWGGRGEPALLAADDTVSELAFGDFDGDGIIDVFKTSGVIWYVRWGREEHQSWKVINSWLGSLNQLVFTDLNQDGKTDILISK